MKISEFINGRSIKYQTVRKYIKSHPELFKGHIGRPNNIILDKTAVKILEEKYPLPKPIVIEDQKAKEEIAKLQEELLHAQRMIINLQQQVVENAPKIMLIEQTEKELEKLQQELEIEKAKTWWDKFRNK